MVQAKEVSGRLHRHGDGEVPLTADERSRLVLAFAKVLHVNGQATEQTVSASERLARALGLSATVVPRWGGLELLIDGERGTLPLQVTADPVAVDGEVADRERTHLLVPGILHAPSSLGEPIGRAGQPRGRAGPRLRPTKRTSVRTRGPVR